MSVDAILWLYLSDEILIAMAEDRLPRPAIVPVFARLTVRPGRPS